LNLLVKSNPFITLKKVEHPVTEMITEQDLVEWQLRIAAGEELPIKDQNMIPCIGNSMEARIYAENPAKDFLPVTGRVWHHRPPVPSNVGGKDVRVDTGLEAGTDVSVYYDPMVSKLIVHGKDREEARVRLIESLQNYQIAGVPSNIPFLIKCAQHPVFAEAGAINTGFLEDYANDVKVEAIAAPIDRAVCGLVASLALEARYTTDVSGTKKQIGPWSNHSGSWRLGTRHERVLKVDADDDALKIICNHDGSFDVSTENDEEPDPMTLRASFSGEDMLTVLVNGSKKHKYTAICKIDTSDGNIEVNLWSAEESQLDTNAVRMVFEHPLYSQKNRVSSILLSEGKDNTYVKAPMPGKVTRMNFEEGDIVGESDVILVIEAMKMEHAVTAKMAGVISKMNASVGDIINDSEVLCILREDVLIDESTNIASA